MEIAYAVADLLDQKTMPGERDEALWRLLKKSFEMLEVGGAGKSFLDGFRQELFSVLGYHKDTDETSLRD